MIITNWLVEWGMCIRRDLVAALVHATGATYNRP